MAKITRFKKAEGNTEGNDKKVETVKESQSEQKEQEIKIKTTLKTELTARLTCLTKKQIITNNWLKYNELSKRKEKVALKWVSGISKIWVIKKCIWAS